MEIKTAELTMEVILKINAGINEIANMVLPDPIVMMDLGLMKAEYEKLGNEYKNVIEVNKLSLIKSLKIKADDKGNISAVDALNLNAELDKKVKALNKDKKEVKYPIFTRKELESWMNADKNSDNERAFKPSTVFFINMTDFIIVE